jgi:hypothetical protein
MTAAEPSPASATLRPNESPPETPVRVTVDGHADAVQKKRYAVLTNEPAARIEPSSEKQSDAGRKLFQPAIAGARTVPKNPTLAPPQEPPPEQAKTKSQFCVIDPAASLLPSALMARTPPKL